MNVVQEIHRINAKELESGSSASWHDQYKDSAYIYVGGLPHNLTEGDVITIFSQYGEVVDVSLPRDPATQKPKGFAFLMYADQRSTILAVDNLGGSKVLERTLRVDHVLNYKQLERDKETGKMVERDIQSLAAHPDKFKSSNTNAAEPGSPTYSSSSHGSIDLDDPMRDYLIRERKAAKLLGGSGSNEKKRSREGESKEERKERRDKKKKAKEMKEEKRDTKKGKEKESNRAIEGRRDDRDDRRTQSDSRRDYDDRRDSSSRKYDDDYGRSSSNRDVDRRSNERDRDDGRNDSRRRNDRDRNDDDRRTDRRERDRDDGKSRNSYADLEKYARG